MLCYISVIFFYPEFNEIYDMYMIDTFGVLEGVDASGLQSLTELTELIL